MRLNSRMYVFNRINGLIIDNSKADKDFTVHNVRHGFKTGVTYLLANVFNTAETREIVAKLEDGIKNSPYKNHISTVYVDEAYRKLGIATSLIAGITAFSSREAFVVVGEFNTPAIKLYEKLGFVKVDDSKFIKDNNLEGMVEYILKRRR